MIGGTGWCSFIDNVMYIVLLLNSSRYCYYYLKYSHTFFGSRKIQILTWFISILTPYRLATYITLCKISQKAVVEAKRVYALSDIFNNNDTEEV